MDTDENRAMLERACEARGWDLQVMPRTRMGDPAEVRITVGAATLTTKSQESIDDATEAMVEALIALGSETLLES